jgi:hypothetical protein
MFTFPELFIERHEHNNYSLCPGSKVDSAVRQSILYQGGMGIFLRERFQN